ncbi:hypothetical protein [Robinsoniella sp. KNHs210]|uniref:hypothetical protein n=1 Tax=Robinsoniella sp. KNHs210 TaxID=1469950 RepID=UPI0012DE0302|nr:hypothetical protein [Robinsoniella sp. KNHs210]
MKYFWIDGCVKRPGKLSYSQMKSLERKLDKLEDYKDSIEDYLEDKYELINERYDD